jgi:hypothetical protein
MINEIQLKVTAKIEKKEEEEKIKN